MTDYMMKEAERLLDDVVRAATMEDGHGVQADSVYRGARAALLAHIQRGAVPEGWNLDESEAALLHHLTTPDDEGEHSPITLRAGNVRMDDGTVKFGLLCEYTDYPDEGATLLVERPETAPDHFRDAAKMMAVQPSCMTCGDHGMVGGLLPNGGGYEAHSCPDCTAPAPADDTVVLQPYGVRAKTFDPAFVESLTAPAPADDRIAAAIHYPECWDTAAYPTVESALSEVYAHYRCTEHDAPAEVPMPKPVAYGFGNTAITGHTNRLMMVRIDIPGGDQYAGAFWLPLVLADEAHTYGAACRAAGEAAGYARGWKGKYENPWQDGYTSGYNDGVQDGIRTAALRGEVKP